MSIVGEANFMVLEFDHLRDKKSDVSVLIGSNNSWLTIQKEIEKCQVLCSNCHKIKTHTSQKSYKWKAWTEINNV